MQNDINKVAQAIADEISKYPASSPAGHGTFHHTLGLTKRESEARQMAGWFLSKVEKMTTDDEESKAEYNKLQNQLIELAIAKVGK
jgi:hypothetical protein